MTCGDSTTVKLCSVATAGNNPTVRLTTIETVHIKISLFFVLDQIIHDALSNTELDMSMLLKEHWLFWIGLVTNP